MIKLIVLFCLVSLAFGGNYKSYDGYKIFLVNVKTINQLEKFRSIRHENGIDFLESLPQINSSARVMISPDRLEQFTEFLTSNQITHNVIVDNVETIFERERVAAKKRTANNPNQIDFTHFWTNDEINQYLKKITKKYPNLATLEVVGHSYEGRPIHATHISLGGGLADGTKPIILIDTTMHAREWIATMVGIHLVNQLVEHSAENLDILEKVDWVIVAVVNPDGYEYTHTTDRMWRKTRKPNVGTNCVGVDINRNFDINWDLEGGASNQPCSEVYRGTKPNTESEVIALSTLMQRWNSTKLYICLHSYGQYIFYPWGYAEKTLIDNWQEHHDLGLKVKKAISNANGTQYRLGTAANLMYPASGASDDFAAAKGTTELSFTIELPGGGELGFNIEAERIPQVLAETFPAFREYGKYVSSKWG